MTPKKHILLLLENGVISPESLLYSTELASRMKARLHVLMLVAQSHAVKHSQDMQQLDSALDAIRIRGVMLNRYLRSGDKVSELLKFLARAPTISTVIWGGDATILKARPTLKRGHWFTRVRQNLHCPIVVPVAHGSEEQR